MPPGAGPTRYRADRALAQLVRPMTPGEAAAVARDARGSVVAHGDNSIDPARDSRKTHDRLTDAAFEATAAEAQVSVPTIKRAKARVRQEQRAAPPVAFQTGAGRTH